MSYRRVRGIIYERNCTDFQWREGKEGGFFVLLDEHFERCIQKWVRGFFFSNVYNKAQLAFLGLGGWAGVAE